MPVIICYDYIDKTTDLALQISFTFSSILFFNINWLQLELFKVQNELLLDYFHDYLDATYLDLQDIGQVPRWND